MPQIAPLQTVTIGNTRVTFLPDGGGIVEPLALYPASTADGWEKYPETLDDDGKVITSIGGFLIEQGVHKIAVDLGMGPVNIPFPGFGPFFGGRYLESLAQTGVAREAVTAVFFTHLHLDHTGWTTLESNGRRELIYPNARYLVNQTEWEFWYGGENPAGPHPEFVQQPLADRIEFVANGDTLAPGITALHTPGHTPGHMSLRIDGDDMRLFLTADVFHGKMQLTEPDWCVAFDLDADQAQQTRQNMYPALTQPHTWVGINHFADHVFGRMRAIDNGYAWEPQAA